MRNERYRDGVLTVIAVLLGMLVLQGSGVQGPSMIPEAQASSQPGDEPTVGGLVSAGEQRKVMIAELRRIGARLDRIETRLNSGLNVKVTDMPPIKLPKEEGK